MDIIHFAIAKPVSVIVGVILLVMFGLVAFASLPIQLSPNVESPVVSVYTIWPGATPYEIERDIVEEQEQVLKGIPGLQEMESSSANSRAWVSLRFDVGTDIDDALLRVSNKLDEVPRYPENVDKPIVSASNNDGSPVVILQIRPTEGNPRHIDTYLTFFENDIRQHLERIDGVGEVDASGGSREEMQVIIDPDKLALYGLTIGQVTAALRGENVNVAAGNLDVGRRAYRIRSVNEFRSAEDILKVPVISDGQRKVSIRDLADVGLGFQRKDTPVLQNGEPGINIFIRAEAGTNVLRMTEDVETTMHMLNERFLVKEGLEMSWLSDQREYITGAMRLLTQNILIGGTLAVIVLLLFLRSLASTLIVALAIPISIIGSFIVMRALGTSLNIVSLAGIAFAVGMLVDNAIVVLENIDRHRRMGKVPFDAAYDGTREVWGAVLASSLTTIAVFLPVIFLEQEAGKLFRDIAIAVTSSVTLSLFVSILVIPMVSRQLFENRLIHRIESRSKGESRISKIGHGLSNVFMGVIGLALRNAVTRLVTICSLVGGAAFTAYTLFPSMEYLPSGNSELIFNRVITPPGLSYEERLAIGEYTYKYLEPYYEPGYKGSPGIKRIFYIGRDRGIFMGVISADKMRTRELLPICQEMIDSLPGAFGVSTQSAILRIGRGGGRDIDVDLMGSDFEEMASVGERMMAIIKQEIPDAQIRPQPSLDVLFPEVRIIPNGEALRAVNMTAQEFSLAVDVLMDGRDIGDYKQEGRKKIDLVVKVADTHFDSPEHLYHAQVPTPMGTMPVASLSELFQTTGLESIRHRDSNRTFSLEVTPPEHVTIEETMEIVQNRVIPHMEARGMLDGIFVKLSGTADRLTETRQALQMNFLLAAAITYLLMSALFGNFLYPIVIMLTVPLAGAGGFIGLRLVNIFVAQQHMDILTMLGFIILVGVVVNNAILIVHQSLNNIRVNNMDHRDAVIEATRSRLRPIYMTAATSIFGMMPLVIYPGPGAELYKGLGSVVLGGLAMSTIFTVFLIPSMLMFFIRMENRLKRKKPPTDSDAANLAPAK